MNIQNLILGTLSDSGPANMRELLDALHVGGGPQAVLGMHFPLQILMRNGQVQACCGVYSIAPA